MTKKSKKRYNKFLKELTELGKKHSLVIEWCGGPGGPFLSEMIGYDENGEYILIDNTSEFSFSGEDD